MSENIIRRTPRLWGPNFSTDSAKVEQDYNTFAESGVYDATFDQWGYKGPHTTAEIFEQYIPRESHILDAACGSGLVGRALQEAGYTDVDGIDISQSLLDLARETGAYRTLVRADMQVLPLPFDDDSYDAVCLIGSLTYFERPDILRDLCRITRSGGYIVFSQRDDLMRDLNYGDHLDRMEREGLWQRVYSTDPMPYLPSHPDYGTKIKMQYFVYRVL